MATPISVLIIAAYSSVRAGLRAILEDAGDIAVVGQGTGSGDLEELLSVTHPDVLLIEDTPGDRTWLTALTSPGEYGVVLLGEERDGFQALSRLSVPGWGYLLKGAEGLEIAAAVRAAAAGLIVIDRSLAPFLTGELTGSRTLAQSNNAPGETLSPREREVLQLMAQGLPNKQIAARLGLSAHTIKFHVASILAKLGAASRTEAVTLGARRGDVLL